MLGRIFVSFCVVTVCLAFLTPVILFADSPGKLAKRIEDAAWVLEEFMDIPDRAAVVDLIRDSAAVAIFPSVYKGAFVVGAHYGKGVMVSHDKSNNTWSAPAFATLGGGSFGFQIGGEAIDLILVIMNKKGLESLLRGKGTLGADISIAAGPIGRNAQVETDIFLKAAIYSYSKAKGAFIGMSIKGAVIAADNKAGRTYYDKHLYAEEILFDNRVSPGKPGLRLINSLNKFLK